MAKSLKVNEVIKEVTNRFSEVSETPSLDARIIVGLVLSCSKEQLVVRKDEIFPEDHLNHLNELVERRLNHEPIAYLTGEREFWGINFEVNGSVLIPRPDTETIILGALQFIERSPSKDLKVVDLGTGSGCIAIALAVENLKRKWNLRITAIDNSSAALSIAQKNANYHNVLNQIKFVNSDWFEKLGKSEVFDIIVSNPPYLVEGDPECGKELMYEPKRALYSGNDGLEDIAEIINSLKSRMATNGGAFIECGHTQAIDILSLLPSSFQGTIIKDLAGIDRVVFMQMKK